MGHFLVQLPNDAQLPAALRALLKSHRCRYAYGRGNDRVTLNMRLSRRGGGCRLYVDSECAWPAVERAIRRLVCSPSAAARIAQRLAGGPAMPGFR